MKKSHIILLLLIAGGLFTLSRALAGAAASGNFETARNSAGKPVKITGELLADRGVDYDPEIDPNSFGFWMTDDQGEANQVVCYDDLPYDFEKSDEVILTGSMHEDGIFYATDLLVKCPSKYIEEEIPQGDGSPITPLAGES